MRGAPILEVSDLVVDFHTPHGISRAVDGASFEVYPGETLGLVGESGSGKSVSALSVMGLLSPAARVVSGAIRFGGRDLLELSPRQWRRLRGREISMVFQEPMTSLNPLFTVGRQVAEAVAVASPVPSPVSSTGPGSPPSCYSWALGQRPWPRP